MRTNTRSTSLAVAGIGLLLIAPACGKKTDPTPPPVATTVITIEAWWTTRNTGDAIAAAKAAVKGASDLEVAAQAKNDEGVTTAQRALGATCMSCHTAHRERLPDGTFEIK